MHYEDSRSLEIFSHVGSRNFCAHGNLKSVRFLGDLGRGENVLLLQTLRP